MSGTAYLSGAWRYKLTRHWDDAFFDLPAKGMAWIMLNPSTADATNDDPTIRRCIRFAKTWGYNAMTVVNVYALRATNPRDLWLHEDPVGPMNLREIEHALTLAHERGGITVAAWGTHARPHDVDQVLALPHADTLQCLGVTKDGHPRHPLYVKGDTMPIPWPVNR